MALPPSGPWKLNTDASYVGDSDATCLGLIVRDRCGFVALSMGHIIRNSARIKEAEGEAVKLGLKELSRVPWASNH